MAYYNANQPYYDGTHGQKWGPRNSPKSGWVPWVPGGGGSGVTFYYMNKVWDPYGSGQWVSWETVGAADPSGAAYPDPYGLGYGACSGYRLVSKRFV